MAIIVDHEARKKDILSKALTLFTQVGYADVTFQKIADRCGVTRTTLYVYYKNKRQIFMGSIKQFLLEIENEVTRPLENENLSATETLKQMLEIICLRCEENIDLFKVILGYFIHLQTFEHDAHERVRRRIIRLQHHLSTILIRGMNSGEFKNQSVKELNEIIYALFESGIFRLSVLEVPDMSGTKSTLDLLVDHMIVNPDFDETKAKAK